MRRIQWARIRLDLDYLAVDWRQSTSAIPRVFDYAIPLLPHQPHPSRLDLWEEVNSESFYGICTAQIASRSLLTPPTTQQHAKS